MARYRRTFKNHLYVMLQSARKKYPIYAKLKGGQAILIENSNQLYSLLRNMRYDVKNDTVVLDYCNHNLKIFRGIDNGDILGIFHEDCYRFLPVENKIVVDIGANIADSAIYFACRGAFKIIAVEPYVRNYAVAKKNIEINMLSDKVELLLGACSDKSGYISLEDTASNVYMSVEKQQEGTSIELVTLEYIIQKYQIECALLKMDCEGSEYPIIINARKEVLRRFTHIQIEYHYGYKGLVDHLEKSGFRVYNSKPTYRYNRHAKKKKMYVGWLYAERI